MAYYIERGINSLLAVGLIFVLVSIALYSIYYQGVFGTVTGNLTACNQQLAECGSNLNTKVTRLNTTEGDLSKFQKLYDSQSLELSNTKEALQITTDELNKYRKLYDQSLKDIDAFKKQVQALTGQVTDLTGQVSGLKDSLSSCRSRLASCTNSTG